MYFFPANNLQGGNQIIDLQMGKLLTIAKVVEIYITYVVINVVEKWRKSMYLIH